MFDYLFNVNNEIINYLFIKRNISIKYKLLKKLFD